MPKYKKIEALASWTQQDFDRRGANVDQECETVAEAKERAKYMLTTEYQDLIEASGVMMYSQVVADGIVLADYFHKDHPTIVRFE
jgi:hypothetical protein